MKHMMSCAFVMIAALGGAGSASANGGTRTKELYAVFDLATAAPKRVVIKALLDGMANNLDKSETLTPVVLDAPPAQPGHFKVIDPTSEGPMASMYAMLPASQRAQLKRATCDGAVWTADAVRHVEGMQTLHMTLCLFPYQGGFALDAYGVETEDHGGGLSKLIGRAIASKIVGTPDAWTSKVILDLVRSVRVEAAATVKYTDGSIEFQGEPWLQDSQLTAAQEHLDKH